MVEYLREDPANTSVCDATEEGAKPFLRWSGGKRRAIPQMAKYCPESFGKYYEPFVGAGTLYFYLKPKKALISDINFGLTRAYSAIKEDPCSVDVFLKSIPHNRVAYEALRSVDPGMLTEPQAAARFIYLMKSCFNGVYRENKAGKFNTPWGDKVYRLPDRLDLENIKRQLQGTQVKNVDFEQAVSDARSGDFIYFDPPYPQGRYRGEFGRPFTESDLMRLLRVCDELSKRRVKIMLSYVESEFVARQLKGWNVFEISPTRSVAMNVSSRGRSKEIVVTNYKY
jgi:DNA adenine methylase